MNIARTPIGHFRNQGLLPTPFTLEYRTKANGPWLKVTGWLAQTQEEAMTTLKDYFSEGGKVEIEIKSCEITL